MKLKEHTKMRRQVIDIPGDSPAALICYYDVNKKKMMMHPYGSDEGLQDIFMHIYEFVDGVIHANDEPENPDAPIPVHEEKKEVAE